MLKFGKRDVGTEEFYGAKTNRKIEILMMMIVISKRIETNNNSKYLIG